MTTDLLIDGMLSGTGVRDAVNGGFLQLADLGLTAQLIDELQRWKNEYEQAHFQGFPEEKVQELDEAGLLVMAKVQAELPNKSVGYYSDGRMVKLA